MPVFRIPGGEPDPVGGEGSHEQDAQEEGGPRRKEDDEPEFKLALPFALDRHDASWYQNLLISEKDPTSSVPPTTSSRSEEPPFSSGSGFFRVPEYT